MGKSAGSLSSVTLTTGGLTLEQVVSVARGRARVRLGAGALAAVRASRAVVEKTLHDHDARYGINTGFGSLAKQRITNADLRTLQRNLVRSHSAGVGEPLRDELVAAMMLILAGSLARGHSGVRPVVVQTLLGMLNAGLLPVVPSIGSVGASGDLAPLAHIALAAIGEGRVRLDGREMPAAAGLRRAGVRALTLEAKEGLALINGTHLMAAEGALLCHDAERLFSAACVGLAMSIDACRATDAFLDPRLYAARNHLGAATVAGYVRTLLKGSKIVTSHVENDPRVQDPYSLRAGPTVLGAVMASLDSIGQEIESELAAVTDNPLVFTRRAPESEVASLLGIGSDGEAIVSGANFHGMPLAIPLDGLAIALAHIAGIAERRVYLMTGAFEPESNLKPFLAPRPGLQSGLMIAQYTAAACVNEMVGLANPASVANVPTCAGMEDYNSFGPRSAAKARRSLELAEHVVAIELLCAAQGLECHRPLRSGRGVERAYEAVRGVVAPLKDDRPLSEDIASIVGLIRAGVVE
jgi:histidine ammonia-lyase